ncbi:pimeloyl-ACP methyl ester carboxylesterase [Sphingobium sp. B7D2B]|uniref:DUF7379 domain-containing protein n=1 Tax=Sphingobium sp. B7D2B TaxID=2940583 RepID=UPI0022244107|nr:alpha/beta fold hydrolase [Sphingobium sp. B7D2B]MCW2367193.1 pimeloyl-ACP methyl ester carboxylesterase [Sphingobium sp. B7D2B]
MKPTVQPTVVLIHGFAGFAVMNRPLAAMLRSTGYQPVDLSYDSWRLDLEGICKLLGPRLEEIDTAGGSDQPLHIVCHSMGGLVARALIKARRPARLCRVVMLGTPNAGSEIADTLHRYALLRPILGRAAPALVTLRPAEVTAMLGEIDYPVGIIAGDRPMMRYGASRLLPGPSDGKVSVASTRLKNATDHIVLPLSHMLLPYHPAAHAQIKHFLSEGRFAREAGL